jgi:hypothetical protein
MSLARNSWPQQKQGTWAGGTGDVLPETVMTASFHRALSSTDTREVLRECLEATGTCPAAF